MRSLPRPVPGSCRRGRPHGGPGGRLQQFSGSSGSSGGSKTPIVIGASLSLTGDFSADGQAFEKGYKLWASEVNSQGGILGRQVKLDILNDNSSPTQVDTNYQKLITVNHVDLTFGPFSSLLTAPASATAHRYGYAFVEGAGGGAARVRAEAEQRLRREPAGRQRARPVHRLDQVAARQPAAGIRRLPDGQRPVRHPAGPAHQAIMQPLGIKTVYSKIFPEEESAYKAPADDVAASGAQMVVLGSTDVPTVSAFMTAFEQQHYNPKIFIAAAGPDQGPRSPARWAWPTRTG